MSALLLQEVLPVVVSAILLPLLAYLGQRLAAYLKARISNETIQGLLVRLDDAALVAVSEALQVSVDAARKASADGKLPSEAAKEARAAALGALRAHISAEEIAKVLGISLAAAERVQEARLEAAVMRTKRAQSHRVQQTTATP